MNPSTRVVVCAWNGKQYPANLPGMLPLWTQHQCPVTIFSPEDAPLWIEQPGVGSRLTGKQSWVGEVGIARVRIQLEALLTYPEKFFFFTDADAFCLTPEFPQYLYRDADTFWVNLYEDHFEHQAPWYPPGCPKLAFMTPLFFSRKTVAFLLEGMKQVPMNPRLPYSDNNLMEIAWRFGYPYAGFEGRCSIASSPDGMLAMIGGVRREGLTFIHSIKTTSQADQILAARQDFLHNPPRFRY